MFSNVGMTSSGIRYSNIDPLHERSTGAPPDVVNVRPSANQLSCGSFPCAMATKFARARLGCEKVIEARIEATIADVVSDGELAPRRIEEKVVVHLRELGDLSAQKLERRKTLACAQAALAHQVAQRQARLLLGQRSFCRNFVDGRQVCVESLRSWRTDGMSATLRRSRIPGDIAGNVDQRREQANLGQRRLALSDNVRVVHSAPGSASSSFGVAAGMIAWARASNSSSCVRALRQRERMRVGSSRETVRETLQRRTDESTCGMRRKFAAVSLKPWNSDGPTIGASAISARAARSVSRCPARLPLSTVEM